MTTAETTLVRGACPHDCPDTCATVTEVRDGRAVRFYAEKDHPVTQGWLCAKVRPYLQRISWGAAVDEIAARWQAIIAAHGAAAIQPYSYSGTLGLLQNGISSARLW